MVASPRDEAATRRIFAGGARPVRLIILAATLCFTGSAQANPVPESSTTGQAPLLVFPILLEAICVVLLLRRFRTPRHFLLWVLGMHLVTFPLFLGLLFLSQILFLPLILPLRSLVPLPQAFLLPVVFAEGWIVALEAGVIRWMCCCVPPGISPAPIPSAPRCLAVSLAGNLSSVIVSTLVAMLLGRLAF